MTAQEIFDAALFGLRSQGRQSNDANYSYCAYRGGNGNKCAVGMLIADDEYDPAMESYGAKMLAEKGLLPDRLLPNLSLLQALQDAHDSANEHNFLPNFEDAMQDVAHRFGLTYTEPA